MRLPLPWICVAAILGTLIASQKVEEAVAVLLSFLMYLLPSERDTLTPTQLVPPAPSGGDTYRLWGIILAPLKGTRPGKTGQWDEAILLDSCPWLHGTLLTLFRRAPSNRRVWRFFFSKRGHSRGLPGGGVKAGAGASRPFPLRPSPWRCQRGPSWRQPRGARSEASRQAAQRPQPPKVWQADPTSSSVGLCPRRHPVLWRACQSRPRDHLHGPVLHSCSTLGAGPTDQQCANALQSECRYALRHARRRRYQLFLDVSSGTGGISKALKVLGCAPQALDIKHGPQYDVTRPAVMDLLLGWMASGAIMGIWCGTLDTTWSSARSGPAGSCWGAWRSNRHLMGVPGLSQIDQWRVCAGNATLKATCTLLSVAVARGLPAGLSNPVSSRVWRCTALRSALHCMTTTFCIVDACQFGMRFRKRLGLQFGTCIGDGSLCKLCLGKKGWCSASQRRHIL